MLECSEEIKDDLLKLLDAFSDGDFDKFEEAIKDLGNSVKKFKKNK